MNRDFIVAEARRWKGTPFSHQGRVLGKRVDCVGLISMVARAAGAKSRDVANYTDNPDPIEMKAILDRELINIPIADAKPGDIFWMIYGSPKPRHLAIFTGTGIIHAYSQNGAVVEHELDEKWRRRVRAVYRYPGIEE